MTLSLGIYCGLVLGMAAWCQSPAPNLSPGSTFPEHLRGGAHLIFHVNIATNQTFPVALSDGQALAGVLTVLALDGSELC